MTPRFQDAIVVTVMTLAIVGIPLGAISLFYALTGIIH